MNIIVAAGNKGEIGLGGFLPWGKIKEDMTHFKEKTLNSCVIMGRKTFESIPPNFRPLKGRINIIVTSSVNDTVFQTDETIWCNSYDLAYREARRQVRLMAAKDTFVIGGKSAYEWALSHPDTSRLYLTRVIGSWDHDVSVDALSCEGVIKGGWVPRTSVIYPPNETAPLGFSMLEFKK